MSNGNDYLSYASLNPTFLFLSGLAPHKNLWRLPELADELSKFLSQFKFMLSVKKEDFLATLRTIELKKYFIANENKFVFVGTIPPSQIDGYYKKSDFLVSLSDLESFSNNYMEAWKAGIPLIVSNRDFSRSICCDSALYIEPHNPQKAALDISNFVKNYSLINYNVKKGKELLKALPSTSQRTLEIIDIVKSL